MYLVYCYCMCKGLQPCRTSQRSHVPMGDQPLFLPRGNGGQVYIIQFIRPHLTLHIHISLSLRYEREIASLIIHVPPLFPHTDLIQGPCVEWSVLVRIANPSPNHDRHWALASHKSVSWPPLLRTSSWSVVTRSTWALKPVMTSQSG